MKSIKNILVLGFALLWTVNSCINDFLEIDPKNIQTEKTALQTYDNFLTYSWFMYAQSFPGALSFYNGDDWSPWWNNLTRVNTTLMAYNRVDEGFQNAEWRFDHIRKNNIMLDNIDQSQMSDKDKEHWRSVGLFFRAFNYFRLLNFYGAVPWAEHVVQDSDEDIIYGPRTPRDEVAANILRDLLYAEEHIYPDGDGVNTINVHVVRAVISRFGLFEGTWRKYHGLGNANTYLTACVNASEKLMQDVTELHNNYDELFNVEDLTGMKGVLLFKQYVPNVWIHYWQNMGSRGGSATVELSKQFVEKYLCSDGKPISTSPLYDGDKTPYDEFRNRDYRLLFTVLPPYRVYNPARTVEWRFLTTKDVVQAGNPSSPTILPVTKEDSTMYREYIDLLAKISKPYQKSLPAYNASYSRSADYSPRFRNYPDNGISAFSGQHGYWYWKYYDTNPQVAATNSQDLVLFRIEETLLNYAEAKCELGQFTQDVADRTINKIRPRVNVANMIVPDIDENFDLDRDQDVSPVLWEIRRERMVEFMGEDFLCNDVRRWKKGEWYNIRQKGIWAKNADWGNILKIEGYDSVAESADKEGYVVYLDPPNGWQDRYYLFPIPLRDLVLNPQLEQNPGWAKPE